MLSVRDRRHPSSAIVQLINRSPIVATFAIAHLTSFFSDASAIHERVSRTSRDLPYPADGHISPVREPVHAHTLHSARSSLASDLIREYSRS